MSLITGEFCMKEGINNLGSKTCTYNTATQSNDIRIVVQSGHLCHEAVGAQCATDSGNLVGCDGDTDTGTTDQDTLLTLTGSHCLCGSLAENLAVKTGDRVTMGQTIGYAGTTAIVENHGTKVTLPEGVTSGGCPNARSRRNCWVIITRRFRSRQGHIFGAAIALKRWRNRQVLILVSCSCVVGQWMGKRLLRLEF